MSSLYSWKRLLLRRLHLYMQYIRPPTLIKTIPATKIIMILIITSNPKIDICWTIICTFVVPGFFKRRPRIKVYFSPFACRPKLKYEVINAMQPYSTLIYLSFPRALVEVGATKLPSSTHKLRNSELSKDFSLQRTN